MSTTAEYRNLLVKFLPMPIRSDRDYQRALAQLEELMVPQPDEARSWLIEVLSTLIEDYESREYRDPQVSPAKMLAHLLESRGVKCADVAKATGIGAATISSVLTGRRGISKSNVVKLAPISVCRRWSSWTGRLVCNP